MPTFQGMTRAWVDPSEAKVQALLEEAEAIQEQARLYVELAHACRRRAAAERKSAQASEALAESLPNDPHVDFVRSDGHRAARQADLNEKLAERHEHEASRAAAEALRAKTEAETERTRARLRASIPGVHSSPHY
jgi:hypothetical protein